MADSRKLIVEVIGDTRNLERSFRRSQQSAKQFEGTIQRTGRSLARSFAGASAALLGAGGLVYGLQQSVKAAVEAEQVLAQTEQAVKNAGLSWFLYGKRIQAVTLAQSRISGFMDEQLLGTFSAFVRRTGDVNQALKLNALAADIARGANIDLETASKTVLRALGGQARGLAILGVQVRKGATSTELITALQDKFAGSSERFAKTAAGTFARFNVALDETKETLGQALLPTLTKYLNQATRWLENTDNQKKLQGAVKTGVDITAKSIEVLTNTVTYLSDSFARLSDENRRERSGGLLGVFEAIQEDAYNVGGAMYDLAARVGLVGDEARKTTVQLQEMSVWADPARAMAAGLASGRPWADPARASIPGTRRRDRPEDVIRRAGLTQTARNAQRNLFFDNSLTRLLDRSQDIPGLRARKAELGRIADLIRAQIAIVKDVTRRLNLEDKLVSVLREQKAIQDEITAGIKEANQALKERADAIKSAILDRLQRRQTDVLNRRALADAQDALRIARRIGGPSGIEAARRGVQDVRFDIARARLERAPASLAGGRFALGNVVTINVNGSDSPEAVAQKVVTILQRNGKKQTKQRRGPYADQRAQ